LDAIKSITDIFEGQPLNGGDFEFSIHQAGALHTENGFGNRLSLSEDQLWNNVKSIQAVNEIQQDKEALEGMNFLSRWKQALAKLMSIYVPFLN